MASWGEALNVTTELWPFTVHAFYCCGFLLSCAGRVWLGLSTSARELPQSLWAGSSHKTEPTRSDIPYSTLCQLPCGGLLCVCFFFFCQCGCINNIWARCEWQWSVKDTLANQSLSDCSCEACKGHAKGKPCLIQLLSLALRFYKVLYSLDN